jgi:peptidoglycan/LPS O-acetylase OafA/YrhL
MWLALAPVLTRRSYEPGADLSYGTYLYGWPVQQSLHALFPGTAAAVLLLPSLAVTAVLAAASWYGIEQPALALKARTLGRRTLKTIEPAAP